MPGALLLRHRTREDIMSFKDKLAAFLVDRSRIIFVVMLVLTVACALMIPLVTVNSDMTKYLADSSPMKQGVDIMAEEFPNAQASKTVRLMATGLSEDQKPLLKERLKTIDGVDSVTWEADSPDYNKENYTLYVLSTPYDYGSSAEKTLESSALELAKSSEFNSTQAFVRNNSPQPVDLPLGILLIALAFLTVVLLVMCRSWMEPVIYLITIGCAVGINLGTNVVQGSIAQITFSIGAILQLVLSMDYSIILMNRFRQELWAQLAAKKQIESHESSADSAVSASLEVQSQNSGNDICDSRKPWLPRFKSLISDAPMLQLMANSSSQAQDERIAAMKRALAGAITAIAASSLTTFVGLLTLVFMTFKIGGDLGVVLAKGVLLSLVCVFTILPSLILMFHKPLARAAKPAPTVRLDLLARIQYKLRYALPVFFVAVFAGSYVLQSATGVSYTLHYEDPIAEVFSTTSQVVVLYDNQDEETLAELAHELEENALVSEVNTWSTTLGKPLTASELGDAIQTMDNVDITGFDPSTLTLLYSLYESMHPALTDDSDSEGSQEDSAVQDAQAGLEDAAPSSALEALSALIPGSAAQSSDAQAQKAEASDTQSDLEETAPSSALAALSALIPGSTAQTSVTQPQEAGASDAQNGSDNEDVSDSGSETAISIEELARFLNEDVLTNALYSRMISDEQKGSIQNMQTMLDDARSQLQGEHFSIMSLTLKSEAGAQETTDFMNNLADLCDTNLKETHYLIGDAAMVREMRQGFGHEMLQITLISALAIFVVVAFAFKSLVIPLLLVLIVQCGVYLTVVAIGLQGYHIYYLAMLIVQCILMGATIDYGILITNQYREARLTNPIPQSLAIAYNNSINTIMTSGLIIILVTGALAFTSPEPTIGQICQTISMGAASAVILILFMLPGMLAAFDRFVRKS